MGSDIIVDRKGIKNTDGTYSDFNDATGSGNAVFGANSEYHGVHLGGIGSSINAHGQNQKLIGHSINTDGGQHIYGIGYGLGGPGNQ